MLRVFPGYFSVELGLCFIATLVQWSKLVKSVISTCPNKEHLAPTQGCEWSSSELKLICNCLKAMVCMIPHDWQQMAMSCESQLVCTTWIHNMHRACAMVLTI